MEVADALPTHWYSAVLGEYAATVEEQAARIRFLEEQLSAMHNRMQDVRQQLLRVNEGL